MPRAECCWQMAQSLHPQSLRLREVRLQHGAHADVAHMDVTHVHMRRPHAWREITPKCVAMHVTGKASTKKWRTSLRVISDNEFWDGKSVGEFLAGHNIDIRSNVFSFVSTAPPVTLQKV